MARLLVLANEATAAQRRVYFHLVDATDGLTAETGEAGGQPQVSSDGGAWTNTGIGTLNAIGNGRYYADLTQTLVQTAGTLIETRYKSAATAECPGDSVQVVAFDPNDAQLGMSARLLGTSTVTNLNTIFDTDYASVYNTSAKCLLAQLDNNVAHGGGAATLELGSISSTPALLVTNTGGDAIQVTASGSNGDALQLAAHGTGSAILATGGATGHGINAIGGATSGNGIKATGTAGNSAAVSLAGQGSAAGLLSTGGATGNGVEFVGGATSGNGLNARAATSGNGISVAGATAGSGISATGGASGHGMIATGGATNGNGIVGLGQGTGAGLYVLSADTGVGLQISGGGTSGDGVSVTTVSGHGVNIAPVGTAKHGVKIAGGNGATADGVNVAAGTGGVAVRSASNTVTGATTYTGNVSLAAGLSIAQSSAGSPAMLITGNGAGAGIDITGGATGDGIVVAAGGGSARALHLGSLTVDGTTVLTGAVSMGSTFAVASTATLNALTVTNATTLSGAVTATNASNDIRGIALHATQAAYAPATAASLAAMQTDVTAVLADTSELQTDWANGGRLDLLVDAILDDTGTSGVTIATATMQSIADETLKRGVSSVEDTANTTSLAAIILAILESSVSGTTWTIRKTGGATFVAKTITTDAAADPITGVT